MAVNTQIAQPVEIRLKKSERRVEIDFDDGNSFVYPAEFLRVESPSAEVKGHDGVKRIVPGCRYVGIDAIEPVGHYAVVIRFDDGHDTGIFSWEYLHRLGTDRAGIWRTYLDAVEAKGLSRDPAGT